MWIPTHVKVTVHKARNLKIKGRSGGNDSYVVIHVDDQKYTTSVKTRNTAPEWNENYDVPIPSDLRHSVVRLSVHHRNLFSLDDLLGQTSIALQQYPIYDRPQSRWYSLAGRRESGRRSVEDNDEEVNGEVQVTLTFMVQSQSPLSAEQTVAPSSRIQRQRSLSFRSLASRVGMKLTDRWASQNDLRDSPLTDLTERKFSVHLSPADDDDVIFAPNGHSPQVLASDAELAPNAQRDGKILQRKWAPDIRSPTNDQERVESSSADDGCGTDQGLNLSMTTNAEILCKRPVRPRSLHTLPEESHESKTTETKERLNNAKNVNATPLSSNLFRGNHCATPTNANKAPTKAKSREPAYSQALCVPERKNIRAADKRHSYVGCGYETASMVAAYRLNEMDDFMTTERQRLGSSAATTRQPSSQQNIPEAKDYFEGYDRDDLIKLVREQQSRIQQKQVYVQDLEDYIDGLLIRVLDANTQSILENPYNRTTGKRSQQPRKADDSQKKALDKSTKKRLIDIFKMWKQ